MTSDSQPVTVRSQEHTAPSFGVNFGSFPAADVPDLEIIDSGLALCEELGFASVWFGDHFAWPTVTLDPTVMLPYVLSKTNLSVGTDILLLALRHPVVVARAFGTMSHLWPGRVSVGVGMGGENPAEYAAVAVPLRHRGRRLERAIEIVTRLLAGEAVSTSVPEAQLDKFRTLPVGIRPPVYAGGRADAAVERAGRVCDGWIGYLVTPEGFERRMTVVRQAAAAAHRPEPKGLLHLFVRVVDESSDPPGVAAELLAASYGSSAEQAGRLAVVGDEVAVAAGVQRYLEAGASTIIFRPLGATAELALQLRRLARVKDMLCVQG